MSYMDIYAHPQPHSDRTEAINTSLDRPHRDESYSSDIFTSDRCPGTVCLAFPVSYKHLTLPTN